MTKYGICTWTLGGKDFEEKLKISHELGLDGVELEGKAEDIKRDPAEVKAALKKYDLEVLSITPDDVEISSSDAKIRKDAVSYYLDLVKWAKAIDADRFVIHGKVGVMSWDGSLKEHWDLLVDSVKKIVSAANEAHIEAAFECVDRYENFQVLTAQAGLQLIKDVDLPNFTLVLDSYHMNIDEANPVAAISDARKYLSAFHVGDSNRQAVGNGHADLMAEFQQLKHQGFEGPVIMEMLPMAEEPFNPVKEGNYIEVLKSYYTQSLTIMKAFFSNEY